MHLWTVHAKMILFWNYGRMIVMKCRHCGFDLDENVKICPNCKKSVVKLKAFHVVLLSVFAFVILATLCLLIMKDQGVDLSGLNPQNWFKKDTVQTVPVQTATQGEDGKFNYNLNRVDYTAAAEDPAGQAGKVAAKIGDVELTNAELQAYYWYYVLNFLTESEYYAYYYGMDLATMGLDTSKPLSEQTSMDGEITWQKFFLEAALTEWHKYNALALQGKSEGYVMSKEMSDSLNSLYEKTEEARISEGFSTLDEMLKKELGPLSTEAGWRAYMETYYYAMDYLNTKYAGMEPTAEEVEAYYTENQADLAFTKDTKQYGVRHILIEPKGGTENDFGNKTYTDAEWEACRAEAQGILDQWLAAGGKEADFAALAGEKSTDTGSAANGGLYEGLTAETNFVSEFKDWYLDPARQVGDSGLVKSIYGYHIMYLSSTDLVWQENCKSLLWTEKRDDFVEKCMQSWPVSVYDASIAIGEVSLTGE